MLILTREGLYCRAGNFHIDPKRGVENAVVTHAHADHARRGSKQYFCAASGEGLLKARLGKGITVSPIDYGKQFRLGDALVSFHPAGHILGSAQVRIECRGEVWVCSGDYKRDPDPTCEPFETVKCDVFVTEATFGTPGFTWKKDADLATEIFDWWTANANKGINSVLFAYSLGKTQRVLGLLHSRATRPIFCHPAAAPLNECYAKQGMKLAATRCLSSLTGSEVLRGELFLVPQAFLNSDDAQMLGDNYETAFASGWMARDYHSYDKGFLLSDHADWNDLLQTIKETGAQRVYVQHRGHGALVKHLNTIGIKAFPESALELSLHDQLELF